MFLTVRNAYEVLSNAEMRAEYDAELKKRMSVLRGYKRPPPLESVRHPVYYKMVDGEYYTFESAPDKLKCTFRHGDIICLNDKLGCFIGFAGDNYFYWCLDGQQHATRLCQKGSFAMDSVKVVVRANFKSVYAGRTSSSVTTAAVSKSTRPSTGGPRREGGRVDASDAVARAARPPRLKEGRLSEAERLRRQIMRHEWWRYTQERMAEVVQLETTERCRLEEEIGAALLDEWQEFRAGLAALVTKS